MTGQTASPYEACGDWCPAVQELAKAEAYVTFQNGEPAPTPAAVFDSQQTAADAQNAELLADWDCHKHGCARIVGKYVLDTLGRRNLLKLNFDTLLRKHRQGTNESE